MFKKLVFLMVIGLLGVFVLSTNVFAGAKIDINDEASLDIGFLAQPIFYATDKDLDSDGNYDSYSDFKMRRTRLKVKGILNDWLDLFYMTEAKENATDGTADMRSLDAWVHVEMNPLAQLYFGQIRSPGTRQELTTSAALMTIDRPSTAYKSLSWGTTSKYAFTNQTYSDGSASLKTVNSNRDSGITFFGADSFDEELHYKYYLGIYDGVQKAGKSSKRLAGRVQVNFMDPESGYSCKSTYLGKKETVGVGFAFDTQSDIAINSATGKAVDYSMYTIDLFAETFPTEENVFTFEAGYVTLDLGDAAALEDIAGATLTTRAKQTQGDGYYTQIGYLMGDWQPWIGYESWDSDASNSKGCYDIFKIGVTYYLKGHNANVKVGYEMFEADQKIGLSNEDSAGTFLVGMFLNY